MSSETSTSVELNSVSSSSQDTFIDQLDQTLARFSDDPSRRSPSTRGDDDEEEEEKEEKSMIRAYAPKHLERPFQELYSILYPCLRPRRSSTEDVTTTSAIVMGPRGSGKSLLVERCLAACQHAGAVQESETTSSKDSKKKVPFRKVAVNGIVVRGEDVPSVVYEIIRQLSDMALHGEETFKSNPEEGKHNAGNNTHKEDEEDDNNADAPRKRRRLRRKEQDEYLLRLRKSTFTSNLALLESTLKMAEVDRIPVVLILDELDAFILKSREGGTQQHRQLLLYHLLDRVATPGSNLTLIGITSNFMALTQMEKRIRSRAEGTSKIVYVRPPATYEQLLQILVEDKLWNCPVQKEISKLLQSIATVTTGTETKHESDPKQDARRITNAFQREFRMGRDLRWFCRVLSTAVSLYRLDCVLVLEDTSKANNIDFKNPPVPFAPNYLMEALAMMGCLNVSDEPIVSDTKQSSLCLVEDVAVDPRLQASLLDLSEPQVALLLAARRILARQAHLEQAVVTANDDTVGLAPLTLQRMMKEYQSFRRAAKEEVLMVAAQHLLERGVLVPSLDHVGGGPLQYHVSLSYQTLDPYSLKRLPLHLPVGMERELGDALQRNLLNCSTALKEWGRKTN